MLLNGKKAFFILRLAFSDSVRLVMAVVVAVVVVVVLNASFKTPIISPNSSF